MQQLVTLQMKCLISGHKKERDVDIHNNGYFNFLFALWQNFTEEQEGPGLGLWAVTHRLADTVGRAQAPGRILLDTQSNKINHVKCIILQHSPVPTCHKAS